MDNENYGRIEDPREAEYLAYATKQLEEDYLRYIKTAKEFEMKGLELYSNELVAKMNFDIRIDYMNLALKTRRVIGIEIVRAQIEYNDENLL